MRAGLAGAVALLIAAAAASLGGCAKEPPAGIDAEGRVIEIGNGAEPLTLDPQKSTGQWENNIIGNMFVGLTTEDAEARIIPGMALRWETSEDGLTWTFFLREAQWSDGTPVTAYDFEYAYRRVLAPESLSEYAPILYPIRNAQAVKEGRAPLNALGVRAVDERTLEITLDHPASYLPGLLKHSTAYPVPKHVVEQWGDDWIKPQHVVVNGPYTLAKWWSNYLVHLKKNPLFYDAGHVCLNELFFYPTNDTDTAVRRVQAGELAWSTRFPGQKAQILQRELPGYVRIAPWMLTQYFSINTTRPAFKDARVRQALSMAVDRDFIARRIYQSGYEAAYQFVPPTMPGYPRTARLAWADEPMDERRAEARKLLEAAGYGPQRPLRFAFSFRNGGDSPRVAVVAQSDWHAIAPWVQVELRATETQIHYSNLRAKNFDIGDGGWIGDYADAQNYLFLLETRTGSQNYPGYSSPQYDALMQQAGDERDPAVRGQIMAQAEQVMLNDTPNIPLAIGSSQNLVTPRITGWRSNIEDIHRARWMCLSR
ncbi:MAG: peptide ABC transporter substrate-binding protein [Hyphomonadaceae bacterium]